MCVCLWRAEEMARKAAGLVQRPSASDRFPSLTYVDSWCVYVRTTSHHHYQNRLTTNIIIIVVVVVGFVRQLYGASKKKVNFRCTAHHNCGKRKEKARCDDSIHSTHSIKSGKRSKQISLNEDVQPNTYTSGTSSTRTSTYVKHIYARAINK